MLGSEALTAVGGSFFFEKEEATRLLNAVSDFAADLPRERYVQAAYTGSAQDTSEVFSLFESAGINIVADDIISGDRYADADVAVRCDMCAAIAERYILRPPSSERGAVAERARVIPRLVETCGARALIVFMLRCDELYIWDLPSQLPELDRLGVRVLVEEKQTLPPQNAQALKERCAALAGEIKEAESHGK